MLDLLLDPGFWAALFSVTLVQIALGADNLIIITILANKLPLDQQKKAVRWGLILAMVFRIMLLGGRQLGAAIRRSAVPPLRLHGAWESTSRARSAARRSSSSVVGCS